MTKETSIGAVIYKKNKKIEYLLLHKLPSEHYKELWDFPRGNPESGETQAETAAREIKEETGLTKISFDKKFKEKTQFFYRKEGETIFKQVIIYLAELTGDEEAKVSEEHADCRWMSYEKAMKTLTYSNSGQILEKADKYLNQKKKQKTLADY